MVIMTLVSRNILQYRSLKNNSRYTIGEITNFEPNSRSGYRIDFVYKVQNKEYRAFDGLYEKKEEIVGKRFYVKFSQDNPKNCQILLSKPVPFDIENSPTNGWTTIETKE